MLSPQPDDHAVSRVNLHWAACLPIRQHGVDRIGRCSSLGRQHNIGHILFEMRPFGTSHGGTLANDLQRHLAEGLVGVRLRQAASIARTTRPQS